MQHDVMEYRGCEVRPVVTADGDGRYTATAIVNSRDGETRTLGINGTFAGPGEARDEALELAIAWIQQRSAVSPQHVRRNQEPASAAAARPYMIFNS
ncbi:hypothetical protein [Paraburkholderia sp. JHI869]|uniref:hypothetical protein n=1 Tax=Paraburkholderia sp. JHI869 TaxID=3112959 RepID=UPI003179DE00